MTKREEFELTFKKSTLGGVLFYDCYGNSQNNQSLLIATTLDGYNKIEVETLLEEIELAETGGEYEEFYQPDSLGGSFRILIYPPNVHIANGEFTISLQSLKELLKEWLEFLKT